MHAQPGELHLTRGATARAAEQEWIAVASSLAAARGRLVALSSAAASIGALLGDASVRVGDAAIEPLPTAPCGDPLLLDALHHVLLDPRARRAGGVARTPPALASMLVRRSLELVPMPDVVLDPACGGGVFLVATAAALHDTGREPAVLLHEILHGFDVDPVATAVTRAVLALWARCVGSDAVPTQIDVVDSLHADTAWGAPDLVVGNPPFRSPLGSGGATRRAGDGARYADDAARFLGRAVAALAPGGVCTLLVPRSLLAASDAAAIRSDVMRRAVLRSIWLDDEPRFATASVRVAAPMLQRIDRVDREVVDDSVVVLGGEDGVPCATVDATSLVSSWAPVIAAVEGVPRTRPRTAAGESIGDRWKVTAGFRDEFYALATSAREHDASHRTCAPVVTSGLIDPLRCWWSERATRLGGVALAAPCIEVDAVDASSPKVAAWVRERLVPKVLIASQGRVVEAVADPNGVLVPCTPVISAEGDDLWALLAVLCAPGVSARLATARAGTGRSTGAMRLSAASIRALPLPAEQAAWGEAAQQIRSLSERPSEVDADVLRTLGHVLCEAYGDEPSLVDWWLPQVLGRRADAIGA